MSADAWIFQRTAQLQKLGPEAASWNVGWYEPNGRRKAESCGPGDKGKFKAEKRRKQIEAELMTGTYQVQARRTWPEFLERYRETVLAGKAPRSRDEAETSLAHFERIVKPGRLIAVTTETVDLFTARRRVEKGKNRGDLVSPATVNKDLRHVKAALGKAKKWGWLVLVPEFDMERTPKQLARWISGEHFAALYAACDSARMPETVPNIKPADWWRALITMGYLTGWRISELLALKRADVDLDKGTAVTRAEDNKGNRDARVKLHPIVVDHLRRVAGFTPCVFPWNHNRRTLDTEFHRVQRAAKINLPCPRDHEHTDACHSYGFHDLRRAFATMNADKLTADQLQELMRHKSYQTTKVYIDMTRQMDDVTATLHVPDVLKHAK
jgi:integrase